MSEFWKDLKIGLKEELKAEKKSEGGVGARIADGLSQFKTAYTGFKPVIITPTETPTQPQTETPTSEADKTATEAKKNTQKWWIIGGVGTLIIIVIVFLATRKY